MTTVKTPHRSLFALLLAALLLTPPVRAQDLDSTPTGGPQTLAVVALSGYERVMSDADYIGALVGMPQASQMVEGMVAMMAGPNALDALDKQQPWGVIVRSGGMDISPIVCLPVTDLDALLAIGANTGVVIDDLGNGVRSASMQGQSVFLKAEGGWVFAAQNAALLTNLPDAPAAELAELVSEYDLGAKVLAQNIPPMFKQMLLGGVTQGVQQNLEQQPDETDEQFALRKQMAEKTAEDMQNFVEGLDEANLGITVNPEAGGLVIDAWLKAVEGTPLAAKMAVYEPSEGTQFAGFLKAGASISAAMASQATADALPRLIEDYQRSTASLKQMLLKAIREDEALPNQEVRNTLESILEDVSSCVEQTVRQGKIDTVGHAQLEKGGLSILAAACVAQPEKLDTALKKAAALTENDPEFPPITWSGEKHEGVDIHSMVIPIDDFQAQQVLGGVLRVAVGVGPDAVYLSVGPAASEDLKDALDASAAAGATPIKPMQLTIGLAQLMEFSGAMAELKGEDAAVPQMLSQLLSGEEKNHLRLTIDSLDSGIRYKIVCEEGVLKAVGATVMEMQNAMGAGAPAF